MMSAVVVQSEYLFGIITSVTTMRKTKTLPYQQRSLLIFGSEGNVLFFSQKARLFEFVRLDLAAHVAKASFACILLELIPRQQSLTDQDAAGFLPSRDVPIEFSDGSGWHGGCCQ